MYQYNFSSYAYFILSWCNIYSTITILYFDSCGDYCQFLASFCPAEQTRQIFLDLFFCCTICGDYLLWSVNGTVVLNHVTSLTSLGDVSSMTSGTSSNSLLYSSSVLSKRSKDNQVCLDTLLVVTQTTRDLPVVACQSNSNNLIVQYNAEPMNRFKEIDNITVVVKYSEVGRLDVVSPDNNFVTQILLCRSFGTILTWSNQSRSFDVSFDRNIVHAGDRLILPLSSLQSNVTLYISVVLDNNEQYLTTAIFWTDYSTVGSCNHVSCRSQSNVISTMVNIKPGASTPVIPITSTSLNSEQPLLTSNRTSMSTSLHHISCKFDVLLCIT